MWGVFERFGASHPHSTLEAMRQNSLSPTSLPMLEWRHRSVVLNAPQIRLGGSRDAPTHAIAVAGRLDNREQLFEELGAHAPDENTEDTTLIAIAYEQWGRQAAEKLVGPFVIVAWEDQTNTLTCIRDHLGAQPFYYCCSNRVFAFSCRIGGVLAHPATSHELDDVAIGNFLAAREKLNRTFYQGVHRLPAGHYLEIDAQTVRLQRYWFPERIPELHFDDDSKYAEGLRTRVVAAVEAQLRGANAITVSLSGGLDSSAIAVVAARAVRKQGKQLSAVCAALPDQHQGSERDERDWIELVLEQEALMAHYVSAPEGRPFDDLEYKFDRLGQPFRDLFHYLSDALCDQAKELGAPVMLNGLGGDMAASFNGRGYLSHLLTSGRLSELIEEARKQAVVEGKSAIQIIKREVLRPAIPPPMKKMLRRLRGLKPANDLEDSAMNATFARWYARKSEQEDEASLLGSPRNGVHRQLLFEVLSLSGPLEQLGIAASLRGVDLRFPLVDRRVIEYCLAMPPEQFLHEGWRRNLMRRAMKGILPEAIRLRTSKSPFSPDFRKRFIASATPQKDFLADLPAEHPVWKYLDRAKMLHELDNLAGPDAEKGNLMDGVRTVGFGLMFARFMVWHEERRRRCEGA